MCGISGIRKYGEKPIQETQIAELLLAIQTRGIDATGIALQGKEGIAVLKEDTPAWEFLVSKTYRAFIEKHLTPDVHTALLHTRQATQGSPRKNENNHPLYVGVSAVVHNGMISNDDRLFKEMHIERTAETDSDIIRGILDRDGITKKGIRSLNRIDGSIAAAAISNRHPGKLLLMRSGGPLVLGKIGDDFLVFASEKRAIHNAARVWHQAWGITFKENRGQVAFITMYTDSAWVLGPKGLEWHDKLSTVSGSHQTCTTTRSYTTDYQNRSARWPMEGTRKIFPMLPPPPADDDEVDAASGSVSIEEPEGEPAEEDMLAGELNYVICPVESCGKSVEIPKKHADVPLNQLSCPYCKGSLAGAVIIGRGR